MDFNVSFTRGPLTPKKQRTYQLSGNVTLANPSASAALLVKQLVLQVHGASAEFG